MMTHETILRLPDPLLREACEVARLRDQTVGQIVRDALASELRRARRKAHKRLKAREADIAPIRAVLAADLADASNWADLGARLANKGYALRPAGSGLALFRLVGHTRICAASDLGPGYGALVDRFGGPMPAAERAHSQDALPLEDAVIDF